MTIVVVHLIFDMYIKGLIKDCQNPISTPQWLNQAPVIVYRTQLGQSIINQMKHMIEKQISKQYQLQRI